MSCLIVGRLYLLCLGARVWYEGVARRQCRCSHCLCMCSKGNRARYDVNRWCRFLLVSWCCVCYGDPSKVQAQPRVHIMTVQRLTVNYLHKCDKVKVLERREGHWQLSIDTTNKCVQYICLNILWLQCHNSWPIVILYIFLFLLQSVR